jgi:hypothetical protein
MKSRTLWGTFPHLVNRSKAYKAVGGPGRTRTGNQTVVSTLRTTRFSRIPNDYRYLRLTFVFVCSRSVRRSRWGSGEGTIWRRFCSP